ncbi:MAG: hypothetical protein H7240_04600, partial [Glaciimonas sp.]|nr:hypothetical protein [Glaciimonas sp.]
TFYTSTGYCITPVAGLIQPPASLRADPHEVAEIFEVPLIFLMNGLNHQLHTFDFLGRDSSYATQLISPASCVTKIGTPCRDNLRKSYPCHLPWLVISVFLNSAESIAFTLLYWAWSTRYI